MVNCTGATIPGTGIGRRRAPSRKRTIIIKVTAPNSTSAELTNQAFVDPDNTIPEGDEDEQQDTHDTIVQSIINLKHHKTGPTESSQSQRVEYTITVINDKPRDRRRDGAFGVKMHDPLPVGLIPLAVITAAGTTASAIAENPINVVVCLGDLDRGREGRVTIDVFMTAEGQPLARQRGLRRSRGRHRGVRPGENDNCSTHARRWTGPKKSPDLLVSKSVDRADR